MSHRVETDVAVNRFGFVQDDNGRRLLFPRGTIQNIEGRSGTMAYGAGEAVIDGLEGRLGQLHWKADGASFGKAWLRDDAGRVDMACERVELSRGATLTKADRGVEIIAPHVSLSEVRITLKGPFASASNVATTALVASPAQDELRQGKLRFLDSLTGKMNFTVKVKLDLPVIGKRSLDQELRIPIQEGSLDFAKLEDSLDWLEGRFLDIKHDSGKLALTWKIPIVGSARDLISWQLDADAQNLASFGRVPVRSLADFRTKASKTPAPAADGKRKTLQALSLQAIDIALSLVAPRSVEAGGGMIMFGGDDSPGMVDLKVTGEINDKRPGSLRGAIGSIDTTIKDVRMGSATLAADRLHFDDLDELHVEFDGFTPACVTVVVHRVTATNLNLQLGRS